MQKCEVTGEREVQVVLRLLQGEDLEALSRELNVTPATLLGWKERFLAAGLDGLKSRPTDERDKWSTNMIVWVQNNWFKVVIVGFFVGGAVFAIVEALRIAPLARVIERLDKEIERLDTKIAQQDKTIAGLEEKIEELRPENRKLKEDIQNLRTDYGGLEREKKELKVWMSGVWTEEQIKLLKPGVSKERLRTLEARLKQVKDGPVSIELQKGGGAERIERNGSSFTVSIDDFWEKGTMVALRVVQLDGKATITNVLKGGDMEKIVLHDETYALTVTYVEDPCVKISIEKIQEN